MSVDSAIRYFRDRQAAQFTTTATISRSTGATYVAGVYDDGYDAIATGVPCKIRPAETRGTDTQTGEREIVLTDFTGKFPVNTDIVVNDRVDVTASAYDTGLVGQRFRVAGVLYDEWQIARGVALELVPIVEEPGS